MLTQIEDQISKNGFSFKFTGKQNPIFDLEEDQSEVYEHLLQLFSLAKTLKIREK